MDRVLKNCPTFNEDINMQTLFTVKPHGQFTQEHLDLAKMLIPMKAYPQYYTNEVFKSLVPEGLLLIDQDLILRQAIGNTQSVRHEGINEAKDSLHSDILENGWRLNEKPIFVKRIEGTGKFKILDGVTKDKILYDLKFKNRICMVVDISEDEELDFGNRLNAQEDRPPAGAIKEVDIIKRLQQLIRSEKLLCSYDDIKNHIDKLCGKGKFSNKRRTDLAYQILHQESAIQNSSLEPIIFGSSKEVDSWLIGNNYIETPNVVYVPYAASAPIKAFFAAAKASQQNPGKEVRLVLYVSKLNGYNLQKCYIDAILRFKTKWFDYMDLISNTYYGGANYNKSNVVLYGCVPANIEEVCEDQNKLVVFGKNDQNINENFLTSKNSLFELDDEDEDE